MECIFNWSGGKDSALALYKLKQGKEFNVKYLLTTLNAEYKRISMHGVRQELLQQQAASIGLPLVECFLPEKATCNDYNSMMRETLMNFIVEGIHYSAFGDIFLEDLRQYRENQLDKIGMKAIFPLWKRNTIEIANEFIDLGFKTIITCVSSKHLDESFVGRTFDRQFIADLPKDVDPCGENGEFHSFVVDGPIFKIPIKYALGEKVFKTYPIDNKDVNEYGFWFIDLKNQ